jgi:hypothetical protein
MRTRRCLARLTIRFSILCVHIWYRALIFFLSAAIARARSLQVHQRRACSAPPEPTATRAVHADALSVAQSVWLSEHDCMCRADKFCVHLDASARSYISILVLGFGFFRGNYHCALHALHSWNVLDRIRFSCNYYMVLSRILAELHSLLFKICMQLTSVLSHTKCGTLAIAIIPLRTTQHT